MVFALFEKTRNSVKIKPIFGFLPACILNLVCYYFCKSCRHYFARIGWKHVSIVICLKVVLLWEKHCQKLVNFANFAIFPVIYPLKKVLIFFS